METSTEKFREAPKIFLGRFIFWPIHSVALNYDLDLFFISSKKEIIHHIIERLLTPIRYHRDQRGDDRCWFDDVWLYWHLPESIRQPIKFTPEQMAVLCQAFHNQRGGHNAPANISSSIDPNEYLYAMSLKELRQEIRRLRKGVRKHRNIGLKNLCRQDDEELYSLLHDNIQADFRLPSVELFLPNCALICGKAWERNPNDIDLHTWPDGERSPLADWRPEDKN